VQEAADKRATLSDLTVVWHLIGHLQTNKARTARELFHWVHSIDSIRIAQKLDLAALCSGDRLPVLIQVRLGEEATKSGAPESDVLRLSEQVGALGTLEVRGLMVLPPFLENPEQVRPFFRRLRELAASVESAGLPNVSMNELSMGMSHDFEVAVQEGATMLRVGSASGCGLRPPCAVCVSVDQTNESPYRRQRSDVLAAGQAAIITRAIGIRPGGRTPPGTPCCADGGPG